MADETTKTPPKLKAPKITPETALDRYATWRPRLMRGLTAAGTAAFLSKTLGGDRKGAAHIVIPTLLAGIAGTADATLEDKVRESQKFQHFADKGFGKKAELVEDPAVLSPETVQVAEGDLSVLGALFARRDEVGAQARAQLSSMFAGAAPEYYGRSGRLRNGEGQLSVLFKSVRPLAR